MKKILLLMLSLVMVTTMMAEGVTPDEALNQARNFVKNRENKGMRPHRAPGTAASRLVMAKQVNGLYVFNVAKDEGFVIVSNDDRTEPILGYSDNGHFDPDNMPENMKAWLKGYADQIAWLNEHGDEADAVATLPTLTGTPVKQPIAPLITTLWNQDTPYNDLAPYYGVSGGNYVYSVTEVNGYEHCATGCVATAMAQVMNFNRWPEGNSSAIPSYTWENANVSLAGLPATTFDWNNMIDDYDSGYTTAEGTAVAKLMRYCGQSVSMNYGPSSGANTAKVADALKDYFDYSSTTTYKDRSLYTYAGWIELLYNELAQGRPMVFSGQSTGGGHAFVCDGYQSEDYFHINWGWGGQSDGYFKLSVMNPKEQGIGGSSSDDGFNFGQGAIVGIQKNGGTGKVLNVPTSNFSLSLQGIDFSKNSVALGETVEVTFRIKNDGPDEYSGDIWICIPINGNNVLQTGKTFTIPAGETKDCVIPYTPDRYYGTFSIRAYRPTGGGYYNRIGTLSKTLTVTQGSGGSNNVTLTVSDPVVENSEFDYSGGGGRQHYKLYGTKFNATITVTNETDTDYDGTFLWVLIPSGESASVNDIPLKVSANSHVDIPISVKNLDYNHNYYVLQTSYIKNNSYSWVVNGYYHPKGAIMTYSDDGASTIAIPSGTSFNAATDAPEALAVNVSGTGITSITPNSLANTVYIYSGTKPSGLDGKNVVKYDNGNYTAETITLTDNKDFYSPVDFTAEKIEFNYDFTVAANGTNGWNTLVLPFNVTSVTADDAAIDWFHSSSDKSKNFWVKSFARDESTQVYFDFVEEMKANTPYIVAFPGNKWGSKWDMSNKTIKFIGENVTVSNSEAVKSVTGSAYRFVGNTVQDNTANIYSLNEQGNLFVLNQSAGSAPFRAFFKPGTFDISVTSLSLGSVTGGTTSIDDLPATLDQETGAWYSIDGRRLNGQPTQKGVYIKNGKKTIIK